MFGRRIVVTKLSLISIVEFVMFITLPDINQLLCPLWAQRRKKQQITSPRRQQIILLNLFLSEDNNHITLFRLVHVHNLRHLARGPELIPLQPVVNVHDHPTTAETILASVDVVLQDELMVEE